MLNPAESRMYDLYGRFYDLFQGMFKSRIGRALLAVPFRRGDRVLDIGVGTGLSLQYYPMDVHVTGVDLSWGMLDQAEKKLARGEVRAGVPRSATEFLRADALDLPFEDKSFDVVLLSHVVATVSDPQRCLAEALRVARDHATVVVVNHFRSSYPVVSWVETAIDPICRRLGWRCDLSVEELLSGVGVENLEAARGSGEIFRILYLQKRNGRVRIVSMPREARAVPVWDASGA